MQVAPHNLGDSMYCTAGGANKEIEKERRGRDPKIRDFFLRKKKEIVGQRTAQIFETYQIS